MVIYQCRNPYSEEVQEWNGTLCMKRMRKNQYEMEMKGRGSRFYVIAGETDYGNYICIPDWGIGSPLADWKDVFWNEERLNNYMTWVDAITVAEGLKAASQMIAEGIME